MLAIDALKQAGITCYAPREWVGERTVADAWRDCQRGDWMMRWAEFKSGPAWGEGRRRLVLAACACARLAQDRNAPDDAPGMAAILAAEAWARGEASADAVAYAAYDTTVAAAAAAAAESYAAACGGGSGAAAANAANAAAYAACAAYGAYAVADDVAAYAAYGAYDTTADAAYAAANAAYDTNAADDAAADAAYCGILRICADIVRMFYPQPPGCEEED